MSITLYNGKDYESDSAAIQQAELLFQQHFCLIETLLFDEGRMPFWIGHGKRIRNSFEFLGWKLPPRFLAVVSDGILHLVSANDLTKQKARIRLRLTVIEKQLHYCLEALPLPEYPKLLMVGMANGLRIVPGKKSFLKSNERKVYGEAMLQAKEKRLQDVLLLNEKERIVESTIANVFWEKNGDLFTPPLSEGCVAGVYREALLSGAVSFQEMPVSERTFTLEDALGADAMYLANALRGIRKIDEFLLG